MAVEVGAAFISLQASDKTLDKSIRSALDSSAKHADAAGQTMGKKLAAGIGGHMQAGGAKSADAFTKGFTPKVQGAGKNAMQGLAQAMLGGAEGIGSQVGGGISGGILSAVTRGADGAIAALGKIGASRGWSQGVVSAGAVAAGGLALVGTAAVAAGAELYKIGELWDGVADGITFKTGLIGEQLDAVKESVKNVAADTAASIGDIANVQAALLKGFKLPPGAGLEQLTQQIAQYNAAAQENGAAPLNITEFIKAMKQMNMDGDVPAMSKMLDDLYKVTQNTSIPMNDLVNQLKLLGPAASQFNIPVTGLVQILAAMDSAGVDSKNALIGLRTAWKNVADDPNPGTALRNKISEIRSLLLSTSQDAQTAGEKMATEFFGNKAGPQLAQAIRDGNLELDNFNTKATETGLTIQQMTDNTSDFSQEWTKFKNFLTTDLEPVATGVFSALNSQLSIYTSSLRSTIEFLKNLANFKLPDMGLGSDKGNQILGARGFGGLTKDANPGNANTGGALTPQAAAVVDYFRNSVGFKGTIGGWREDKDYPNEHPAGKALDLMVGSSAEGYGLLPNALTRPGVQYVIWDNKMWYPDGRTEKYNGPNPHTDHLHVKTYAGGGGVSGPGTSTSDSIPAMLSDGEHILTARDVQAMGGHASVYSFRNALHRANGGPVSQAQIPWLPGDVTKVDTTPGNRPDLSPGAGYPGVIGMPEWGTPGTRFGPPPPGWWNKAINPDDVLFPDWMPPGERDWWLEKWGQNRKSWKPLGYAEGGKVTDEERKKLLEQQQFTDLPDTPHQGTGAAPGPAAAPENTDTEDPLTRVLGYLPAAANTGGVAGTSSLAGFLNMGNSVVSGLIDTGVTAASQAASMAISAAGAAAGGGGAAAGPLGGQLASYGIQLAGTQAKRISSYWFQAAAIGADALVAQLFPFGAPRWIGYDYTQFAPQLNVSQIGTTTVEKAMQSMQAQKNGQPVDPAQSPGGPVTPGLLPGQQGVGQPVPAFGTTSAAPINPLGSTGQQPAPQMGGAAPSVMAPPPPVESTSPATPTPDQATPMDPLKNLFGFDQGGYLEPGQLGINMTGRPEPVLTPQQWDALAAQPAQGNGPLVKIDTIYGLDPQDVATQIEAKQKLAMMRYGGRPY